ncbi:MAG: hypothetical protein JSR96_12145 [Proteobacteria bacterium]|nr:hypothetical protein [Pseudomonadota bacterium]
MTNVPADILAAIKSAAKDEWPNDADMQEYYIDEGTRGYLAIQAMDFGPALAVRDKILAWANEYSNLWEDRATFVEDEVEAYAELEDPPEDVPAEVFAELKRKAAAEHDWYSSQLDEVSGGMQHFRYVRDTRAKIGPIRDLLIRMESIIGDECYNDNIQNYSSWGVWEGEGRSFRYPVTVLRNGEPAKRRGRFEDLQPEELVSGHYRFGANQLSIYRALVKIIDMLEADYGLNVPR